MELLTEKNKDLKVKCYHCGDDCLNNSVLTENKSFCCSGCKLVYELLSENNLCTYYNINNFPGNKIKELAGDKFSYLNNKEIITQVVNFNDGTSSRATFFIPAIHCSSCIWLLENLKKLHEGIFHTQINFIKKELTVIFKNDSISLRHVVEILDSIGYTPQLNLGQVENKPVKKDRSLFYKLGIAGFCFGNIMLFSFPDYLSMDDLDASFERFFGYISLLLSLPVFFYCSLDYFISSWNALKSRTINIDLPIALGLAVVFSRSAYEILSHTGTGYLDSFSGLVFFLLIGKWYQKKTYETLSFERDYKSYFPIAITRIGENERFENVPVTGLKTGDRIIVRNNELIPGDGVIVKGTGRLDYSFVSGESIPVTKKAGTEVFAGGRQIGEMIEMILSKAVSQSYFTSLWNQDVFKKEKTHNLSSFADTTGKVFTVSVLLLSLATYAYWSFHDYSKAVQSFAAVLIIFCPCTLALSIPFCYNNAMRILGRHNFYLKNPEVVESLAKTNTIVFDKTGTITSTRRTVAEFRGKLSSEELIFIKSLTLHSTHPLSKIIFSSISSDTTYDVSEFKETPSKGIEGIIRGTYIKIGSEVFVNGVDKNSGEQTRVFISINHQAAGYFTIKNKIRKGLPELIKRLYKKVDLHLLSGDHSGQRTEMQDLFKDSSKIHFEKDPLGKLEYIQQLKAKNRTVLMIGDGLNDAGALKQSDIGISVSDNVYNFSPACDAILDSDHLNKLNVFIDFCKSCHTLVKASLVVSLMYNITGLYFAMSGKLSPLIAAILMPASSVSVVLFVIIGSNLIALKKGLTRFPKTYDKK